jgi:hypothetical protein
MVCLINLWKISLELGLCEDGMLVGKLGWVGMDWGYFWELPRHMQGYYEWVEFMAIF